MPNWCNNFITISGEKDKIDRIKTILNLRDDNNFFTALLGITDETNWYVENLNNLGTKWDCIVDTDSIDETDSEINFSCESAWSPPVSGMVSVCKKYGVACIMIYEEAGNDFYGKTTINSDGWYDQEEYGYREGMYVLDNDWFWENLSDNDMVYIIEEILDDMESDNTYTINEFVKREFCYVTEDDSKKIIFLLQEELEYQKEKKQK